MDDSINSSWPSFGYTPLKTACPKSTIEHTIQKYPVKEIMFYGVFWTLVTMATAWLNS